MNNSRRKEINKATALLQEALSILEEARDQEADYFNGIPENLQSSERGQQSEEAYGYLEEVCGALEEAISGCENSVQ